MKMSKKLTIFSLVFPGILLFIAAVLFPIILSGYYGMTDAVGVNNAKFIGMDNFKTILTDDKIFWKALARSYAIGLAYIIIQHPICIFFAILLDRVAGKLEGVFRAILFVPSVISVVVLTRLWLFMLNPRFGSVNKVLESIGLDQFSQAWFVNSNTAFPTIIVMSIWIGFGWGLMLYYAGLKGIPESLYESAKIDGAGSWKAHWYVTLPMLFPIIKVNITLAMISALKQMEIIYLTTNGGPVNKTEVLSTYLYKKAFVSFEFGYANAISVMFVLICLLTVFVINKVVRKDVGL